MTRLAEEEWRVEFRILGPLEIVSGGEPVRIRAAKQRAVLAVLLLHANDVVTYERLLDELWGDRPPATAIKTLQVYVAALRKALGAQRIDRRGRGYVLRVEAGELDSSRFELLLEEARQYREDGATEEAAERFREALSLWRGAALADISFESLAPGAADRLGELRLAALVERIDCELALGRHGEVVGELESLVAEHRLHERFWSQLMLALYRQGRQAEALKAFHEARGTLVDQLGIQPGPELQDVNRRILRHDPDLAVAAGARPRRATNLPLPASSFVGRGRELAELRQLLLDPRVRLVTLTGAGGSGKSRLALEVSRSLLSSFRDGIFGVFLAPIADPALVLPAIARALSVTEIPGRPLAETVRRALEEQELLLVLDNFEHLLDAAGEVAAVLDGCPRLKLVVTSRAPLRLTAERRYEVPPLSLPGLTECSSLETLVESEAVSLFVERVGAVKPGFELDEDNARQVAEICARLDGLPLALELAAARANVLAPAALLARLDSRLRLLSAGARDHPPRHRTLRAAIDWSYDLLGDSDQALLRRLSVFAGGCRLEAAEAICDLHAEAGDDVFEGLSSLVENSLVLREEAHHELRFSLLETIREYALERLGRTGDSDDLRGRHGRYYLAFAEETEPRLGDLDQKLWLDRLEADHDNLRVALAWLRDSGERIPYLRLATALKRFWVNNDHLVEARRWIESALAAAPDAPTPLRARALAGAIELASRTGDAAGGRPLAVEALALARQTGDPTVAARMLQMQAVAAGAEGDLATAVELCEEAFTELPADAEPQVRARATFMLARFEQKRGNLTRARHIHDELNRDAREAGDIHLVAATLSAFADIALEEGDPTRAMHLHAESLALCRRIGSKAMTGERLAALAATAAARSKPLPAGRLWGALEALEEQLGGFELPPWLPDYKRRIETAAGEEFEAGRKAGRSMELDEAIDYALSTTERHDAPSRA